MFRLDFDYLNELPILVLDVSDDFKNDRIKQEEIIDKVGELLSFFVSPLCVCSFIINCLICFSVQVREFLKTL